MKENYQLLEIHINLVGGFKHLIFPNMWDFWLVDIFQRGENHQPTIKTAILRRGCHSFKRGVHIAIAARDP